MFIREAEEVQGRKEAVHRCSSQENFVRRRGFAGVSQIIPDAISSSSLPASPLAGPKHWQLVTLAGTTAPHC